MSIGNKRDYEYFNCSEEHEFKYVSGKYIEEKKVYQFLKDKYKSREINYSTHKEVYVMIKKEGLI